MFDYSRYSKIIERNYERLETVHKFEEPDRVPVVIGVGGPYYAWLFNHTLMEYYSNFRIMAETQIMGLKWRLEWLKDDISNINVHFDIGAIAEGIVFNCMIAMPDEKNPWKSPWIIPRIRRLEDIDRLEIPEPEDNPGIQAYYSRLEEFAKFVKREYGNIPVSMSGLQIHPPVSAAGSLLGPQRLYSWLYKYPSEMHKLLKKLEKTFDILQKYRHNRIGGGMNSISLADDHSGYLNRRMYEEFALPYNLRLYERYGKQHRGLHMDSRMDHIADIIVNVYKVNYVDVGVENDLSILVENFNGKVVFNGNADWRVLIGGSRERIRKEVERCIYVAASAGGYIFDNGGETYVGVPPENLRYEVEYAKRVGKYPIKRLI
ncbi:MAG: uroporphyrinogen decarboxylase family protein [Candidatus Bathyarchaeia archaeon]